MKLTRKLRALMPKPEALPEGYPSDLFKEALTCLDTLKGSVLTSRLSEIGPLIFGSAKSNQERALWQAVECFYLDSIENPLQRQQSLAVKRYCGAVKSLRNNS